MYAASKVEHEPNCGTEVHSSVTLAERDVNIHSHERAQSWVCARVDRASSHSEQRVLRRGSCLEEAS